MEYVKLTDGRLQTYNGYQWVVGEKRTASGTGDLYTDGWLYCYGAETQKQALLLAEFLHPLHVNYPVRRFFAAKCGGQIRSDSGLKFGVTEMTLGEELDPPFVTTVNRVAFAILCAQVGCHRDAKFMKWSSAWLSGEDRSRKSAERAELAASGWAVSAAWSAARAATATERAAAWSAARAARRAVAEAEEAAAGSARSARRAVAAASGCSLPLGELAEKAMDVK